MKKAYIAQIFFLLCFTLPHAHADEEKEVGDLHSLSTEEIDLENQKIMGRGIVDRSTGESLSLVCVGTPDANQSNECNQVRFIRRDPLTGKNELIGAKIKLTDPNNVKTTRSEVLAFLKSGVDPEKRRKAEELVQIGIGAPSVIGLGYFLEANANSSHVSSAGSYALVIGSMVAAVVVLTYLMDRTSNLVSSKGAYTLSSESLKRSDWNWAMDSRSVRHHYFEKIKKMILMHP